MSITLKQAKASKPGTILHHTTNKNADGTPERWKVDGKPKTWKTRPGEVKIPVKHGMYDYGYVTETDLHLVSIA